MQFEFIGLFLKKNGTQKLVLTLCYIEVKVC